MKGSKSLSVVVADPQFLTRKSMSAILIEEEGFSFAGEVADVDDMNRKVLSRNPDLIIVALSQENEKGVMNYLRISSKSRLLIVFDEFDFTKFSWPKYLNGASMLTKRCSAEEIRCALGEIGKGRVYVCNYIREQLLKNEISAASVRKESLLSERERQVLALIGKGMTTKKIAEKLFISVHTVNNHRKNIIRKLKVKSPVELITYALESEIPKNEKSLR